VTLQHFAICHQRIVVQQACLWMLEARDAHLYTQYECTYDKLLSLFVVETMKNYEKLSARVSNSECSEPVFIGWAGSMDPTTTSNFRAKAVGAPNSPVRSGTEEDDLDDELYI
jgi:hypothetical protein